LDEARAVFDSSSAVQPEAQERFRALKDRFLVDQPETDPAVAPFWAKYKAIFSVGGLPDADPTDLKAFANSAIGAHPGNLSVFNKAWNQAGDVASAQRLRGVLDHLLRGPGELEDRLTTLIDPLDDRGMTGFRESLLTKVLCVVDDKRFLPILKYTTAAGGKREIAGAVFGVQLPAPEATSMTIGRLACWANDHMVQMIGDGFQDLQHAAEFLWWAKDQA
jgi:hypothetical protein